MTRDIHTTERTDGRTTSDDAGRQTDHRWPASATGGHSRRRFLKATAAAGTSALALSAGGAGTAAAQSVVEETCESFGEIPVGENFLLINNDWGTQDQGAEIDMCSSLYDDGSYGYEWETRSVGGDPNYPQSLVGTKPWGDDSGSPLFPIQRGDVEELELELDVDLELGGGEWNLAEEWWLTSEQPGTNVSESITHEIMLVLEWGDQHDHGAPIQANATTDAYGNVIDYWANYQIGWDFHIFRIAANQTPERVDLTAVMDYMTEQVGGVTDDLWVSGIEVGNEYWEGVSGRTTFNTFDVTVNGQSASSGSGESTGPVEPTAPAGLETTEVTETSVAVGWDSVSDVDAYNVYLDGSLETETTSTNATIDGLEPETSYEIGVASVAGDQESDATTTTVTTLSDDGGNEGGLENSQDTTGDGLHNDINGDGSTTTSDVTEFFDNIQNPDVADSAQYDFDGNGDVTISDVIELFESL